MPRRLRLSLAALALLAACSSSDESPAIPWSVVPTSTPTVVDSVPPPTVVEPAPATAPAPEPEPKPEPVVDPPAPILCPGLRHPAHHEPCPTARPAPARAASVPAAAPTPRVTAPTPATGSGRCGGDLPPCSVMDRESGGDPTAIGYGQCGKDDCYGKWQVDPDTAASVGYPRRLDLEPEHVQNAAAAAILARDGCWAWSTCG